MFLGVILNKYWLPHRSKCAQRANIKQVKYRKNSKSYFNKIRKTKHYFVFQLYLHCSDGAESINLCVNNITGVETLLCGQNFYDSTNFKNPRVFSLHMCCCHWSCNSVSNAAFQFCSDIHGILQVEIISWKSWLPFLLRMRTMTNRTASVNTALRTKILHKWVWHCNQRGTSSISRFNKTEKSSFWAR